MESVIESDETGETAKNKRKSANQEKAATQWFSYDKTAKKSTCLVSKCGKKLAGNCSSNQYRHLRTVHVKFYTEKVAPIKDKGKKKLANISAIPVCINKELVSESLVEMIGANGYPLSVVNSSGLRMLLNPILSALKSAGEKLTVNVEFMKEQLKKKADGIREKIKHECQGKLVTVMLDTTTRHNRAILGVKLQYMFDGKLKVRCIGMIKIKEKHSAMNICDMVTKLLLEFNISLEQILSMTSDNAPNMTNIVDLMNEALNIEAAETETDEIFEATETDEAADDQNLHLSEEEAVRTEIEDAIFDESLFESIAEEYANRNVNLVRCVAHTLQLVVSDSLKMCKQSSNLIDKGRNIIKKLRTPTIYNHLKGQNFKSPKIDNDTRWGSKYIMVIFFLFT